MHASAARSNRHVVHHSTDVTNRAVYQASAAFDRSDRIAQHPELGHRRRAARFVACAAPDASWLGSDWYRFAHRDSSVPEESLTFQVEAKTDRLAVLAEYAGVE